MTTPRDLMLAEEPSWDSQVRSSPALTMQRESLTTNLFNMLWMLQSGGLSGTAQPEPGKARAVASRLSLIAPLIAATPMTKAYRTQAEAATRVTALQARSVFDLLAYAHICEVLPDVHRKNYRVSAREVLAIPHPVTALSRDLPVYRLDFPSDEWAATEALDIALSAVALPFSARAPKASPRRLREAMLAYHSGDLAPGARLSARFAGHYLAATHEVGTLSDVALSAAFGLTAVGLARFRAALMGIGEWGAQTAAWLQTQMRISGPSDDVASELFSWTAMNVDRSWLLGVLGGVTDGSVEGVQALLNVFTLRSGAPGAGDGFIPPLVALGERLAFSPLLLQTSMGDRNIAYALNAMDPTVFASAISAELEPKLLDDMQAAFSADPAIDVVTGVKWSSGGQRGEIDALVARPGDRCVLHVQAKGAIPPVGSKAVRHIESRIREGLDQCSSFAKLADVEQQRIVETALNREVPSLEVRPAVLVRTNFGTHGAWTGAGTTTLLTLPLLRAIVREQIRRDGVVSPSLWLGDRDTQLSLLREQAAPAFEREFADLRWLGIDLPIIQLDERALWRLATEWA